MTSDSREIPELVADCLQALEREYTRILGANLAGMYVHGSIAMRCFNPASSDVDVLVVVHSELSLAVKRELGALHVKLASTCPRPIELSVVLSAVLDHFVHPTPFEFHFSNDHLDAFVNGTADLTIHDTDADLAAHFVITKRTGITLVGESAKAIFPRVPHADYLDSLVRDAEWSSSSVTNGPDEGECRVPQYAVLNYCRVMAYLHEELVTSKRTGAEWALGHLPGRYHAVIQAALDEYAGTASTRSVPCATLKGFAEYALGRIRAASRSTGSL